MNDFREPTDPQQRSYWAARIEGDLSQMRNELSALKSQLTEVTRMKWWPVKVLAGSASIVVLALAGFGLWTIDRADKSQANTSDAIHAAEIRLQTVDAQLRSDFQRHQAESEHSHDRMERKLDKLLDVVVEEKRPAVVRNQP